MLGLPIFLADWEIELFAIDWLSPSIWCAKSPTNDPSSDAASAPLGILNISCRYWGRCDVNLDSLPCGSGRFESADSPRTPPYFFSASILAAARVENTQLGNRAR
jgi:hypothetical protein